MTFVTGRWEEENKSFTLLEVLLVVTIAGILIGVAVPQVRFSFTNLQLSDSCKDIVALIRYGQQQAILKRVNYRLNLKIDEGKYWLTVQKNPLQGPDVYERLGISIGKVHTLPDHTTITEIVPASNYITLYPNGDLAQVTIYLSSDTGKTYAISTTEMIGHVLIEEVYEE